MITPTVRVERRAGQRFPYLLPLALRQISPAIEGVGFTQDVSSRGAFFFSDAAVTEGAEIEITIRMPAEITLGESMPVRCRGRVLRVVKPVAMAHDAGSEPQHCETKLGVAVRFEGYEYLSESTELSAAYARVSALHSQPISAVRR
jgi:PilZ domain